MEGIVDTLLGRYEKGTLTRRDLVRGLATLMMGGAASAGVEAQTPGLPIGGLSHVQISASNVRKSTEFYKNIGLSVLRLGPPTNPNCCPDDSAFLGGGKDLLIAIRKGEPAGKIDHFGFKVPGFNAAAATKILQQRGVTPDASRAGGGVPNTGFRVIDPDGVIVELSCLGC